MTFIFLTGSGKGVRGVTQINGKVIEDGNVGEITLGAAKQYNEYLLKLA